MDTSAPDTIRHLLAESLSVPKLTDGSIHNIHAIVSPDGTFDNYLLRVRGLNKGKGIVLDHLKSTTSLTPPSRFTTLTVPDFLFVGPSVSQSLLHFYTTAVDAPLMEVVAKQKGTPIFKYVLGKHEEHDYATQKEKRLELIRELVKPESKELEHLMTQAAFIATQRQSRIFPDFNDGSIMVDREDGHLRLRLLDVVGQEEIDRTGQRNFGPTPENLLPRKSWVQRLNPLYKPDHATSNEIVQGWMDRNWEDGKKYEKLSNYLVMEQGPLKGMAVFLRDYLTEGLERHELEGELGKALHLKFADALGATVNKCEHGTLPAEWKGFQRMTKPEGHTLGLPDNPELKPAAYHTALDSPIAIRARQISAVNLDESPKALKMALDCMSALSMKHVRL